MTRRELAAEIGCSISKIKHLSAAGKFRMSFSADANLAALRALGAHKDGRINNGAVVAFVPAAASVVSLHYSRDGDCDSCGRRYRRIRSNQVLCSRTCRRDKARAVKHQGETKAAIKARHERTSALDEFVARVTSMREFSHVTAAAARSFGVFGPNVFYGRREVAAAIARFALRYGVTCQTCGAVHFHRTSEQLRADHGPYYDEVNAHFESAPRYLMDGYSWRLVTGQWQERWWRLKAWTCDRGYFIHVSVLCEGCHEYLSRRPGRGMTIERRLVQLLARNLKATRRR